MAWPLLCTLPKGGPEKLEPLFTNKNVTTPAWCIATSVNRNGSSWPFPLLFKSDLFQIGFSGRFGKVRNNKLMHLRLEISPSSRCKDTKNF